MTREDKLETYLRYGIIAPRKIERPQARVDVGYEVRDSGLIRHNGHYTSYVDVERLG